MTMERRTMVKYLAGASAAGVLAGCISTEEPESGDDDGGNGGAEDYDEHEDWETVEPEDISGEATLWHSLSGGEQDDFEANLESFNGQFDADIGPNHISDLEEQTMAAIPAGDGPELFMWAHDWIGEYHQNGFLSDQSADVSFDLEEYFGENAESGMFDGELHGLPHAAETVGLIYNKEYVDEPPETFEELLDIAAEHHDPEDGTYGLGWPMDAYHVSAFPHGFGGHYYDDEAGELGLTNSETVEGFEYVLDEVWEYMPGDPDGEAQEAVFLEGNAPFLFSGPWQLGQLDEDEFEWGVAPWPEVEGHTPSPFTGVQLIYFASAMDEDDERADAARAFAEWYTTNTAVIAQMADDHGFIPVHNAFAEDGEEEDELTDDLQGFAAAVDQGQPMPVDPDFQAVWEPLEDEWWEALNGNKSVADAMADAESRIEDAWD
ncbi:sugar ABC transporter substrate-binding protein [Natronococcus pandeyae]|uniref:Sugar ABC transporter substrate-binding protein n=2 Tax=Natronococcus pandeyae TaxID=2055836 RepID=A0A8J8TSF8_9EURY|nr:sugar ABC transporter substrate-binding protein [Natronococcus pandeyae]